MNGKNVIVVSVFVFVTLFGMRAFSMDIKDIVDTRSADIAGFWEFVSKIRESSGNRGIPTLIEVSKHIEALERNKIESYYYSFRFFHSWLDTLEFSSFARLLQNGRLSDDGYEYFLSFSFFAGASLFEAVEIKDTKYLLTNLRAVLNDLSKPSFEHEDYHWVFHDVYQKKYGEDIDNAVDISKISIINKYDPIPFTKAKEMFPGWKFP